MSWKLEIEDGKETWCCINCHTKRHFNQTLLCDCGVDNNPVVLIRNQERQMMEYGWFDHEIEFQVAHLMVERAINREIALLEHFRCNA